MDKMDKTLKDIAKITGYSAITISRVINYPEKVKKETREAIEKEIKRINYRPNFVAKALVSNKTNIIYVYIPSDLGHSSPFFLQVIAGIGEELGERGYSMLIKRKWYDHEVCDGIIMMGLSINDEPFLKALSKEKPMAIFGHNELVNSIDVNNRLGIEMMTKFVISNGYTKLAYVGIDQQRRFSIDRLNGFDSAISSSGLNIEDMEHIFVSNDESGGYEAGKKLFSSSKHPEVVVCATDDMAIGVIRAAKDYNLEVPKDVGITGFDGLGSEVLSHPNLTTIRQPIYEVGKELAKLIIKKIECNTDDVISNIYYEPELVINDSLILKK